MWVLSSLSEERIMLTGSTIFCCRSHNRNVNVVTSSTTVNFLGGEAPGDVDFPLVRRGEGLRGDGIVVLGIRGEELLYAAFGTIGPD